MFLLDLTNIKRHDLIQDLTSNDSISQTDEKIGNTILYGIISDNAM